MTRATRTPAGLNARAVERWFEANVPEVVPPLRYELIPGGRSNITYAVMDAASKRWALRRPPLGRRLASAHDIGREFGIISALRASEVPVPETVGFCEDEAVTGGPFFVTEWVEGVVLRSTADAGSNFGAAERRLIGERVVDTLVAIHAVEPQSVGLGGLAARENYVARQLRRWRGQWESSKTRELPLVERVHDRLAARIPSAGPPAILHGDYRIDNMILTPSGEVAAVLDWELSTLGDPLADVGLMHVYWCAEGDALAALLEPATLAPGFQAQAEIAGLYSERSGRDLTEIDFYIALALWKLAIVLEGVHRRYAAGQYGERAADEIPPRLPKVVEHLVDRAFEVAVTRARPTGA